jgi:hypothetical protein
MLSSKYWNNEASNIKLVYLYSTHTKFAPPPPQKKGAAPCSHQQILVYACDFVTDDTSVRNRKQSTVFHGILALYTMSVVFKSRAEGSDISYGNFQYLRAISANKNMFHIALLSPRILRWPLHFSKICAPLNYYKTSAGFVSEVKWREKPLLPCRIH